METLEEVWQLLAVLDVDADEVQASPADVPGLVSAMPWHRGDSDAPRNALADGGELDLKFFFNLHRPSFVCLQSLTPARDFQTVYSRILSTECSTTSTGSCDTLLELTRITYGPPERKATESTKAFRHCQVAVAQGQSRANLINAVMFARCLAFTLIHQSLAIASLRGHRASPCHCEIDSKHWARSRRTRPRCVFIDLGAGTGGDLEAWVANRFGPVANCPSGEWAAILVEANPLFAATLSALAGRFHGQVQVNTSRAAYVCDAASTFYVQREVGAKAAGFQKAAALGSEVRQVEVQTVNVNRLLVENTIPGDWVMLKMDVEGAEFDILPCMAESPAGSLVDRLYMEKHDPSWGLEGATAQSMQTAMAGLRNRGVDIPEQSPV